VWKEANNNGKGWEPKYYKVSSVKAYVSSVGD